VELLERAASSTDVLVKPLAGGREPIPVADSTFSEYGGRADVMTGGTAFISGRTRTLFRMARLPGPGIERYDVARDGTFLVDVPAETNRAEPLNLVLNSLGKLEQ
jgi:hypothetical protein